MARVMSEGLLSQVSQAKEQIDWVKARVSNNGEGDGDNENETSERE